jgi:8-oxo-dGTP pyrophosphatase MutT (NUDIX family)
VRDRIRSACGAYRPVELPLEDRVPAGVLVLMQRREGAEHLLFQVRTHRVRHHKGEISFPGGRRDTGDPSLLHTALRETHEELGVHPDAIEVLGQLDDTATHTSNYLVRPYVGAIADGVNVFAAAPREVRELLPVPLEHLISAEAFEWYAVEREGIPEATPAYRYGEHIIWGATARVLGSFFRALGVPQPHLSEAAR